MFGDGSGRRGTAQEEDQVGYEPFILMEELIDKLKVLNYDEDLLKPLKMRPLNRHYFAISSNPGEQFFMFTRLAVWLIGKCGLTIEQPQESDDPNSTIAHILEAMRGLGLAVDFSPVKLRKGSGWHIIYCLSSLTNKALETSPFFYKRPDIPEEVKDTSDTMEDEVELFLEKVEEEMVDGDSDIDEDNELNVDDLILLPKFTEPIKQEEVIHSSTTPKEWTLELERVLPLLKVFVKPSSGDWRTHLEAMKLHQSGLSDILASVSSQLNRLSQDVEGVMVKISKREKLINVQLEHLLSNYRALQDELAVVSEQYREVNGGVLERQKKLVHITDKLEGIKQEMEERGASMSDGSPLVLIKRTIKEIKKELSEMDISIAIYEHVLIESKLRDKPLESHFIQTSGIM